MESTPTTLSPVASAAGTLEGFVTRALVSGTRGDEDWTDSERVVTADDHRLTIAGVDLSELRQQVEGPPVQTYHVGSDIDVDTADPVNAAAGGPQLPAQAGHAGYGVQCAVRPPVVDLSSATDDAPDERAGPGASL